MLFSPTTTTELYTMHEAIENELAAFCSSMDEAFLFKQASPLLYDSLKEYILRGGKRLRPVLFVIGHRGFTAEMPRGLYTCALSFELLHNFVLVHDDIIDRSPLRRGKPSMHEMLEKNLARDRTPRCTGVDLAVIVGDILYSLAFHAFDAIEVECSRKERALRMFIDTAIRTGRGEFSELVAGQRDIGVLTREDLYAVYDQKTACYSFAAPLAVGAVLAGAEQGQVERLYAGGIQMGRAFQIKDDIVDIFGNGEPEGDDIPDDLKEAKKTLLLWYAYHRSSHRDRNTLRAILDKSTLDQSDVQQIRDIFLRSGAVSCAKEEILGGMVTAGRLVADTAMEADCRALLENYTRRLLGLDHGEQNPAV